MKEEVSGSKGIEMYMQQGKRERGRGGDERMTRQRLMNVGGIATSRLI